MLENTKWKTQISNLIFQQFYRDIGLSWTFRVTRSLAGASKVFKNKLIEHLILQIDNEFDGRIKFREPSYKEKLEALTELGIWKRVAIEVMPPEQDVVDRADVYHLWEFENPYLFPYPINPILKNPLQFEAEIEGFKYHIEEVWGVKYLYLLDGKELGWRKKQDMKNKLFGTTTTAIEIIMKEMVDKPYTCIVVFPQSHGLDFTLC